MPAAALAVILSLTMERPTPAAVQIGDRVRLHFAKHIPPVEGALIAWTPDSCTIAPWGLAPRAIPTASIKSSERYGGEHGNAAGFGIMGGLTGVVLGAIVSSASAIAAAPFGFGQVEVSTRPIWVGAAAGAVIGVMVGSGVKSERWEPVNLTVPPRTPADLHAHDDGERVRFQTAGATRLARGRLVTTGGDSLLYADADGDSVPMNAVVRLERPNGTVAQSAKFALTGGVVGLVSGLATVNDKAGHEGGAFGTAVMYGTIGAAAGAGIGAVIRTDRWIEVPLTVSMTPAPGVRRDRSIEVTFAAVHF